MKYLKTAAAAATVSIMLSAPVFAESSSTATVGYVGAGAEAVQGNDQSMKTINNGSDLGRGVPASVAPALTTTLSETCMGSTSIGGSGPGFGLSVGSTWRDEACVRRLDSRELRSMGRGGDATTVALFALAGKERMCDDDKIRAAFERVAKMTKNDGALCQATADDKNGEAVAYVEPANQDRVAKHGDEEKATSNRNDVAWERSMGSDN